MRPSTGSIAALIQERPMETAMKTTETDASCERRAALCTLGSIAGLVFAGCAKADTERPSQSATGDKEEAEVTPGEDLMQEHGVIERILLVYEEAAHRIEKGE